MGGRASRRRRVFASKMYGHELKYALTPTLEDKLQAICNSSRDLVPRICNFNFKHECPQHQQTLFQTLLILMNKLFNKV